MEKKRVNLLILWSPVILWCLVIFFGSNLPAINTGVSYWPDFILKKTFHVFEYFTLYLLSWRAFNKYCPKKSFLFAFLFVALYAFSDEIHQSFVPGRESRIRDVIIDTGGGLLGLWFLKNLLPKMPVRLKSWLNG